MMKKKEETKGEDPILLSCVARDPWSVLSTRTLHVFGLLPSLQGHEMHVAPMASFRKWEKKEKKEGVKA